MYFSCARFVLSFFCFLLAVVFVPFLTFTNVHLLISFNTHWQCSCVCTHNFLHRIHWHIGVCWQFCQRFLPNVWREVDLIGLPHKVINFMFYRYICTKLTTFYILHNEFKWKREKKRNEEKKNTQKKLLILAPIHSYICICVYLLNFCQRCDLQNSWEHQTKSRIKIYLLWLCT